MSNNSFSSDIIYLHPDQIQINRPNRQRTDIDTTDLIDSIRENGVINPIIIKEIISPPPAAEGRTGNIPAPHISEKIYLLIAGERRLESCRELGLKVPCRLYDSLSSIDAQKIELEENLKRKDLSWRDEAKSVAQIHNIYLASNGAQTIDQTAKSLSLSKSHITNCLTIAKYQELKLLDSATSIAQAISLLNRFHLHQQQTISSFIANNPLPHYLIPDTKPVPPKPKIDEQELIASFDLIPPPHVAEAQADAPCSPGVSRGGSQVEFSTNFDPITISPEPLPPQHIINQEFRNYILENSGPFNFIHLDIEYEKFESTIICDICSLLEEHSNYIMIWYKTINQMGNLIDKMYSEDFKLAIDQPLIWFQSDIKEYESALIFRYKSTTPLNLKPYIYPAPTPQISTDKKPESMLRFFFNKIMTKETKFFDPECGNGSSLRAADALGVKSILGLSPDPKLVSHGNELIQRDRLLRRKF